MFAPGLAFGAVCAVLSTAELPTDGRSWVVIATGRMMSAKVRAFVGFMEARLIPGGNNTYEIVLPVVP